MDDITPPQTTTTPDPAPTAPMSGMSSNQSSVPKKSNKALMMILVFLLGGILAGGGVYYWMNQKVSDLETKNATLTQTNADLENQLAEYNLMADPAVLATGAASQVDETSDVEVTCHVDQTKITGLHVEFGTDGKTFTATEPVEESTESGMGEAGTLVAQTVTIPLASLTGEKSLYYYQCAGTESIVVHSGVATFVKKK